MHIIKTNLHSIFIYYSQCSIIITFSLFKENFLHSRKFFSIANFSFNGFLVKKPGLPFVFENISSINFDLQIKQLFVGVKKLLRRILKNYAMEVKNTQNLAKF